MRRLRELSERSTDLEVYREAGEEAGREDAQDFDFETRLGDLSSAEMRDFIGDAEEVRWWADNEGIADDAWRNYIEVGPNPGDEAGEVFKEGYLDGFSKQAAESGQKKRPTK